MKYSIVLEKANGNYSAYCPDTALFGISSHIEPHELPAPEVIKLLSGRDCFRTDEHYHTTFHTDGSKVEVKYSHWWEYTMPQTTPPLKHTKKLAVRPQ
jgi:hypothetical protein